jgi:hypothetical protein
MLSYRQGGLVLRRGGAASDRQVRDLQRDLRRIGYLKRGIDGDFGGQTELAVRGLQHDLLHNGGAGSDGAAPVKLTDFNRGRVGAVNGMVDQSLVECVSDILDDARVPRLPASPDPRQENQRILAEIAALSVTGVPLPFLMAILQQESGLKHFNEPTPGDEDTFITVGLDRNVKDQPHVITSRGYGAGQYTLFHHPPRASEVEEVMLDVGRNLRRAVGELAEKFNGFVNGGTSGTRADDRIAEHGAGPLRLCQYGSDDPRFMKDCKQCLLAAGKEDVAEGTPVFAAATTRFASTQYYDMARDADVYRGVPVRAEIPCDWPYAVRRYNGSGINSYHYQVRILRHLERL